MTSSTGFFINPTLPIAFIHIENSTRPLERNGIREFNRRF